MVVARFVILLFLLFFQIDCSGPGTEIMNPPSTGQSPIQAQFKNDQYSIQLTLPPGWTFVEYGPTKTPGPEAFTDIDPATITVAHFQKGESRFTIFYSLLEDSSRLDQSLYNFVSVRHPGTGFRVETVPEETNAYFVSIDDGQIISIYISLELECVWMKMELVGTELEQRRTFEEFGQIVDSIQFE